MSAAPAPIRVEQVWAYYPPIFAGGALRYNQLTPYLQAEGVEIHVLTPRWPGAAPTDRITDTPIERYGVGPFKARGLQRLLSAFPLLLKIWQRRRQFDILHLVTTLPFYLPAALLARLLGKAVIVDFTVMESENATPVGRLSSRLNFFFYRFFDAYIGNSSALLAEIKGNGLAAEKCRLIFNGVFSEKIQPLSESERQALRARLGLQPERVYLLFAGSFIHRKGADILVEIAALLKAGGQPVELLALGNHTFPQHASAQAFADQLRQRIEAEGLSTHLRLLGGRPYAEYVEWLQASDIFLFPSRREGMPRVILEAMSAGLPCVVSSMDGIAADMIEPGASGYVIPSNAPEDYIAPLTQLAQQTRLRQELGQRARRLAQEKFDERIAVAQYVQLYRELLGNG